MLLTIRVLRFIISIAILLVLGLIVLHYLDVIDLHAIVKTISDAIRSLFAWVSDILDNGVSGINAG
jgi:hypothetical protein